MFEMRDPLKEWWKQRLLVGQLLAQAVDRGGRFWHGRGGDLCLVALFDSEPTSKQRVTPFPFGVFLSAGSIRQKPPEYYIMPYRRGKAIAARNVVAPWFERPH
ncbi:hypothetical protein MKI84_07770 [Ancylobacter sp. A5.8]|uniref:hypothetical protein n=1 Tax=Ancylobacter gelatini TaxID=2919920 RepID=UPI001F4E9349|nr:hypothetical protein [Ancylobacter gelatini]MCJ8142813.1 hypothetical protein [Ancylobacter gelatini]